ncbi:MAG: STAS domain-containing protein [Planctomycetota bacterium]
MIQTQTYPHGDDTLVVMVSGQLGANDVKPLEELIEHELTEAYNKLVVDCGKLASISSLGLGMLVRMQSRLKARGGAVALANVQGVVADVLKVIQLDKVLGMYPDIDAAAKGLR